MYMDYIWDFDGMLFDTYEHISTAFIEASRRLGREIPEYEEVFELFSISYNLAYARYSADKELKSLFYAIESDVEFPPQPAPFPGIPQALEYVVKKGGRNFIYSHRDKSVYSYLDKYSLTGLFSGFVTSEDNFPPKPAPDAIEYILKKYSMNVESAIMLGDRAIDVMAGANAGIASCLFDRFGKQSDVPCTYYVTDTMEILNKTEA